MADRFDSTDGRVERAKDAALGKHDDHPSHLDEAGEGVGGIGGVLTGAAIGSAVGPIGTIIGGIAGAVGGWWAGRAVTEAASQLTKDDDDYYRTHYEKSPTRLADRNYDAVRPAYHLGHVAAHNPDYAGKNWDHVSSDLKRGWSADYAKQYGEWDQVSNYASEGYTRGRSTVGSAARAAAGTAAGAVSGAAAGAANVGNKAADMVDDMKDRVDGNPASKPGKDSTDSARRLDAR
jgi:phage tail tape-measure protein